MTKLQPAILRSHPLPRPKISFRANWLQTLRSGFTTNWKIWVITANMSRLSAAWDDSIKMYMQGRACPNRFCVGFKDGKPGVKYNNKLPREVTKTVRSNSEKLLSLRKDEFQGYSHAHQIDEFYKLPGVSDRVRKSTNGRDESEVIVKKTVDSLLVVLQTLQHLFKVKISLELPIFECTNNPNWENELQKLNFSREKARENLCFQDFVVSITQVDTKMTEVEIEMSQKKLLDLFLKCKRKDPICNDKTSKWLAFENFVASSVRAVDQLLENSSTWFDLSIYLSLSWHQCILCTLPSHVWRSNILAYMPDCSVNPYTHKLYGIIEKKIPKNLSPSKQSS